MKNLFPFLLAGILAFSACKNNDDPAPEPEVSITGIENASIAQGSSEYFSYEVANTDENSVLSISVSGLPAGVTSQVSRIPNTTLYTFVLILSASADAVIGSTSTATLTAKPATGSAKSYSFTVRIVEQPACASSLVDSFTVTQTCAGAANVFYSAAVTVDPALPASRIRISNFGNTGQTIYADLNCADNMLTVPPQLVGADTITGGGFIREQYFDLDYYSTTPGTQTECRATFYK